MPLVLPIVVDSQTGNNATERSVLSLCVISYQLQYQPFKRSLVFPDPMGQRCSKVNFYLGSLLGFIMTRHAMQCKHGNSPLWDMATN